MEYKLSEQKPIFLGGEKQLYQHPEDPDLIIKIWRQKHFDSVKRKHPMLFRFMRLPRYSALLHEITEQIAVREQEKDARFIQQIIGIIDTDMGLGLVVEPVRKKDGTFAMTLRALIQDGQFESIHEQALNQLFDWMHNTDVIIRDFTLNNMVWDEINGHFVIIDGIGSKPGISLRPLCRTYNKRANKKRILKLQYRITLNLNPRHSAG